MPTIAEAFNLAVQYHQSGNVPQAEQLYRQILQADPRHAGAHCCLGVALINQRKMDEGIGHYRQALQWQPNYPEAHNNLGVALMCQDKFDEAAHHCQEAMRLRPNYPEARICLGHIYMRLEKLDDAMMCYRLALQINPNFTEAIYGMAYVLERQHHFDEAIEAYQRVLQLLPNYAEAHSNMGSCFMQQGRADLALPCFRRAMDLLPELAGARSNYLFCLNYDPMADPDAVFAEHCRWGEVHGSNVIVQPHANERSPERRLRIGYVSADFRTHAVTRYFETVLANHDQKQFETYCYAQVAAPDGVTARLQKLAHGWRSIWLQPDAEVAQRIRDDRIDILVDLTGHTSGTRLLVFAHKPAPIQVTWFGYLNTTGLRTIDYRLTDDILDPPHQPNRDTEELVRLPGSFVCFAPPAEAPAVVPPPALQKGHITFGSLNTLFKHNARVFDLWSQLLKAVPAARLLMFRDTLADTPRRYILDQFAQRDIPSQRLELRRMRYDPAYLGIYKEIDISLDVFPCSGGVTTCESLWMGVPVLSICGARPAGRHSASLLSRVGLADWAVQTPKQYLDFAVRQANDVEGLAKLRGKLRERTRAGLCDGAAFTRVLEAAYRTMWRRWCL